MVPALCRAERFADRLILSLLLRWTVRKYTTSSHAWRSAARKIVRERDLPGYSETLYDLISYQVLVTRTDLYLIGDPLSSWC